MFKNTRKTIIKILALYLGTSAIFLCIGFYYLNSKMTQNIIYRQMAELRDTSYYILEVLRRSYIWEIALDEIKDRTPIPFAIYDRRDNQLFSNLSHDPNARELQMGFYRFKDKIIVNPLSIPQQGDLKPQKPRKIPHDKISRDKFAPESTPKSPHESAQNPSPHGYSNPHEHHERGYKKSHYKIFLESESADDAILAMRLKLGGALFLVFVAMGIVATILVRLFLKPLNEYISALDLFIKDSTHEINTPLSVILMSIETLKADALPQNEIKKINRIKFASLQLNSIYNALVAYNFPRATQKERLNLKAILQERLEFFAPFFSQKSIEIRTNLGEAEIVAEKNALNSLFDNLISNAIKYNKKGGFIALTLDKGIFSIENSGALIERENVDKIFERYARFGADTGGFGIGLSLVKKICDEYGITISISQGIQKGAQSNVFTLRW